MDPQPQPVSGNESSRALRLECLVSTHRCTNGKFLSTILGIENVHIGQEQTNWLEDSLRSRISLLPSYNFTSCIVRGTFGRCANESIICLFLRFVSHLGFDGPFVSFLCFPCFSEGRCRAGLNPVSYPLEIDWVHLLLFFLIQVFCLGFNNFYD